MSEHDSTSGTAPARSAPLGASFYAALGARLAPALREMDRALERTGGFSGLADALTRRGLGASVTAGDVFRLYVSGMTPEWAAAIEATTGAGVHRTLYPEACGQA